MKDFSLFEQRYDVASYLTNSQGNLGLFALLNIFQDIASNHAELLGLGLKEMHTLKKFWVLTRQAVRMEEWPKWKDEIVVKTWIRLESGPFSSRDFSIHKGNQQIGVCSTSWVSLDAESRKPVIFDRSNILSQLIDQGKVDLEATKIAPQTTVEDLIRFHVRNSDLDHNMHVNNTKYAQWILDAIPLELHFQHKLKSYEVNFLAETRLGDSIIVQKGESGDVVHFQGLRESDKKIVFTSRLTKG